MLQWTRHRDNVERTTSGRHQTVKQGNQARRHSAAAWYHFDRRFHFAVMLPRLMCAAISCDPWPEPSLRIVGNFHG